MIEGVHEAVDIAKQERCPVVVGVPFDLQKLDWQGDIDFTKLKPAAVSPDKPDLHCGKLDNKRPVVLAGFGAVSQDARNGYLNQQRHLAH